MKYINNPLCTHSNENGPPNNHKLVVWMNSFPLILIWVEMHNGLGPSFLVVIKENLKSIKTKLNFKFVSVEIHHKKSVKIHLEITDISIMQCNNQLSPQNPQLSLPLVLK